MYFSNFPLMAYSIKGDKIYKLVPDILRRVKLRANIKNGKFMFDNYYVKEGETPEIVAFKWFGDIWKTSMALGVLTLHTIMKYHKQVVQPLQGTIHI